MAYSLPPVNLTNGTTGFEQLIVYESGQVPILIPGILLVILIVIVGSGFYTKQRRDGDGDFSMWFAVGSFITGTISMVLFLIPGMLNIETLVIFASLMIISILWFLFTRQR